MPRIKKAKAASRLNGQLGCRHQDHNSQSSELPHAQQAFVDVMIAEVPCESLVADDAEEGMIYQIKEYRH